MSTWTEFIPEFERRPEVVDPTEFVTVGRPESVESRRTRARTSNSRKVNFTRKYSHGQVYYPPTADGWCLVGQYPFNATRRTRRWKSGEEVVGDNQVDG